MNLDHEFGPCLNSVEISDFRLGQIPPSNLPEQWSEPLLTRATVEYGANTFEIEKEESATHLKLREKEQNSLEDDRTAHKITQQDAYLETLAARSGKTHGWPKISKSGDSWLRWNTQIQY